jgi:uncharacterized protein (TIGR03382 family)
VHDLVVQLPGGGSSTLQGAFTVTESGCGCANGGASAWLFVAGLALLARRRGN